ncbi:Thiol:disulfide interchange protein CycY precursor (plasmid) [Roseovarius sp. THAF27]|jgi:cytochrome c biogenesis protein CcmG/thiol:disulfide interchange protein DsbE|uniref:Thiol:disulfide oxidoreductase DsbE n=1 Tax=Roseovarius atlanticus TaxID=1641875 RepID=A0A0T5NMT8_9RHOB|nr:MULTISPECIES: DsbE family thiol:disulfide interchange protein [Roseovarius]KZY31896.1 thiol:disulfide interchange protein [Roseovarius sp. HI0049]KRS10292.1 thiol:disulfide oxidoreductase DsbE [Roseovarius atlanticus]QFT83245.1 Thiol:disulfide interchange protein CycY precursor [Roseovarius sp. THAF27]QFT95333.1 Thiol:disulfide interchange protein CycY precursor [Roseovarius sp. THAF9]QFT99788.1 Thiol:disulfide interchange protein CycY precursor [Roseovarius sp. THAF8]
MTEEVEGNADPVSRRSISGFVLVPLIAFALMVLFGWGLFRGGDDLPSALLGNPVPDFALPPVLGREEGLSTQDLIGHVSLVNAFASWCVPCRAEHPLFMELNATGEVPLYGINYKDPPDQARAWLDELGDPYARIGADINGRAGIEWGVYGVPETYVIADGTIAYRHVGPITRSILEETLLPIVRDLNTQSAKETTP